MTESHNPLLQVQQNLRIILSGIITNVHIQLNAYEKAIRDGYHSYLQQQSTQLNSAPGTNFAVPTINDESLNKFESEYRKFQSTLKKIGKYVTVDFEHATEVGELVINCYRKYLDVSHKLDLERLSPQSYEKNQKLKKLFKKLQKIVDKYNRYSTEFNGYISNFLALADSLASNELMVPSKTTGKMYSMSTQKINDWVNRLTAKDEISELRNEIKNKLSESMPPPESLDTSRLQLTPITVLNMPQQQQS